MNKQNVSLSNRDFAIIKDAIESCKTVYRGGYDTYGNMINYNVPMFDKEKIKKASIIIKKIISK